MGVRVTLEVSAGELVDRITILELKAKRLPVRCRAAVVRELRLARAVQRRAVSSSSALRALTRALRVVNRELWDLEEALRACEKRGDFGHRFVSLARGVYRTNDRRAALKRRLDELVGSELREHKSHALPAV